MPAVKLRQSGVLGGDDVEADDLPPPLGVTEVATTAETFTTRPPARTFWVRVLVGVVASELGGR